MQHDVDAWQSAQQWSEKNKQAIVRCVPHARLWFHVFSSLPEAFCLQYNAHTLTRLNDAAASGKPRCYHGLQSSSFNFPSSVLLLAIALAASAQFLGQVLLALAGPLPLLLLVDLVVV